MDAPTTEIFLERFSQSYFRKKNLSLRMRCPQLVATRKTPKMPKADDAVNFWGDCRLVGRCQLLGWGEKVDDAVDFWARI